MNIFKKKNKYFSVTNNRIYFKKEDYNKLVNNEMKKYNVDVSSEVIKEVLNNKQAFEVVFNDFLAGPQEFNATMIQDNIDDTEVHIWYDKTKFLDALEEYIKIEKVNNKQKKKVDSLLETKKLSYLIENKDFNNGIISLKELIEVLQLPEQELIDYVESNKNLTFDILYKTIMSPPFNYKRYTSIFNSFTMDENTSNKIKASFQLIEKEYEFNIKIDGILTLREIIDLIETDEEDIITDKEFVAKYLQEKDIVNQIDINTGNKVSHFIYNYYPDDVMKEKFDKHNPFLEELKMDEDFKQRLLSEIPPEFTDSEKVYYIYRRLCQKFTYNIDYHLAEDKSSVIDINRLKELNEENNKLVCFEFTSMLALFCEELNIDYRLVNSHDNNYLNKYGPAHMKLIYRTDDYMVSLDSTAGIITADLANEKNNFDLKGIVLLNKAKRARDKFSREMTVVDNYINSNYKKANFNDAVEAYKKVNPNELDYDTKLNIFIESIIENKLSIMDKMIYIIELKKKFFPKKDILLDFVYLNDEKDKDKYIDIITIIANIKNSEYEYHIIQDDNVLTCNQDKLDDMVREKKITGFYPKGEIVSFKKTDRGEENELEEGIARNR